MKKETRTLPPALAVLFIAIDAFFVVFMLSHVVDADGKWQPFCLYNGIGGLLLMVAIGMAGLAGRRKGPER